MMPEIPYIFLLFQMMPSAHSNNENNDNESKIKMLKMIGLIFYHPFINPIIFIAEKTIVPGIILLFSLVYWTFGFLCYYDFITHFTYID